MYVLDMSIQETFSEVDLEVLAESRSTGSLTQNNKCGNKNSQNCPLRKMCLYKDCSMNLQL